MCIVLMHLDHPDFAFLVANNRDEFLARPTAPSHWHAFPAPSEFAQSNKHTPSLSFSKDGQVSLEGAVRDSDAARPSAARPVLSGIDVHANGGGTWIGLSRTGRFAALTNFTEPAAPPLPQDRGLSAYRSRGKLPRDWLLGEIKDLEGYLDDIASRMDEWPGFNLLCGQLIGGSSGARIGYLSNRDPKGKSTLLTGNASLAGCSAEGLSNSILSEPWEKVKQGRLAMDAALLAYDEEIKKGTARDLCEEKLASDLFALLRSTPYTGQENLDVSDLPKSVMIPPFKRNESLGWYATRTATVMLVRRNKEDCGQLMRWWERDVHIIDEDRQVERCKEDNQRYYCAHLSVQ